MPLGRSSARKSLPQRCAALALAGLGLLVWSGKSLPEPVMIFTATCKTAAGSCRGLCHPWLFLLQWPLPDHSLSYHYVLQCHNIPAICWPLVLAPRAEILSCQFGIVCDKHCMSYHEQALLNLVDIRADGRVRHQLSHHTVIVSGVLFPTICGLATHVTQPFHVLQTCRSLAHCPHCLWIAPVESSYASADLSFRLCSSWDVKDVQARSRHGSQLSQDK